MYSDLQTKTSKSAFLCSLSAFAMISIVSNLLPLLNEVLFLIAENVVDQKCYVEQMNDECWYVRQVIYKNPRLYSI